MKKRILRIIAFVCLVSILPAFVLFTELGLPRIYQDSYYAELPALYERLNSCEGKKLVLIGGSNIAFGVDTLLLEETLAEKGYDYTVCPFGLYAAVGTSAMLDLALDAIHEGDIVVLSFEPFSEAMSCYFGATAFLKCAEEAPGLVFKLDRTRQASVVGNYLSYLQERYRIVLSGDYPKAEGAYARAAFDDRGNMTWPRENNTMNLGFDRSSPIDLEELSIDADFIEQVESFCETVGKRGASVFYSFCPMNRSAVADSSAEALDSYFALCSDAFPCRIISDPQKYLLDSAWFYDSNVHLNTAGAQYRTILLAEDLLAELGCYESVQTELPQMPEMKTAAVTESEDKGYFTFAEPEDSECYVVTGLTESGRQETSLSVPASYNGRPVAAFADDALKGVSGLEELRIPASVESIPDHLFEDCKSLSRLVLEHTDGVCRISEHSLDGIDGAKIFVPSEAYTYYRDGVGCARNLWSAYLDRIYTY